MRTFLVIFGIVFFCASSVQAAGQITARDAKIDNVQLHYLTAGKGPETLILLHGYAETSRMWRPLIQSWRKSSPLSRQTFPGLGIHRFRRTRLT